MFLVPYFGLASAWAAAHSGYYKCMRNVCNMFHKNALHNMSFNYLYYHSNECSSMCVSSPDIKYGEVPYNAIIKT